MTFWPSGIGSPKEYVEDHEHDTIIFDAMNSMFVCTTCGLVLEGVHSQPLPELEEIDMEISRRNGDEPRNTWLNREVTQAGSWISADDVKKLPPRKQTLFWRLLEAQVHSTGASRQNLRKKEFFRFLNRLAKIKEFQDTFPQDHPKTSKLISKYHEACEKYVDRVGGKRLLNKTKILIFLVLVQPQLPPRVFRNIVTNIAETTMKKVYEITKTIPEYRGDTAQVNMQRKQDFIEQAIQRIENVNVDSGVKERSKQIVTRRARVGGLITYKQPATLAAAALYVAGIYSPNKNRKNRLTKKKVQRLLGTSYIPKAAIDECQSILATVDEGIKTTEQQEILLSDLKQRARLLEERKKLRTQLKAQLKKVFPELLLILNLKNKSTRKLLNAFPSTEQIAKLTKEELITFLTKHSRGKLKNVDNLAACLLAESRKNETIGRLRPRGNQSLVHSLINNLERIGSQLAKLETHLQDAIGAEGRVLMQTPGIGIITVSIMLASKSDPTPNQTLLGQPKSFFDKKLEDAIRIIHRNRTLGPYLDPQRPPEIALQELTHHLLNQGPPIPVSM